MMTEDTWAISERFRDKGLIIKCYINSSVHFTLKRQFEKIQWLAHIVLIDRRNKDGKKQGVFIQC